MTMGGAAVLSHAHLLLVRRWSLAKPRKSSFVAAGLKLKPYILTVVVDSL